MRKFMEYCGTMLLKQFTREYFFSTIWNYETDKLHLGQMSLSCEKLSCKVQGSYFSFLFPYVGAREKIEIKEINNHGTMTK